MPVEIGNRSYQLDGNRRAPHNWLMQFKLAGRLFAIRLKGSSVEHLAAANEFIEPYKITLCRKRYDPDQRISGRTITEVTGKECAACRKQVDIRLMPLRKGTRRLILR